MSSYVELMVQTLKILTDACTSRIVRGQSTLKDAIERYFWNGLSRERLKAVKALYALKAMKHANAGADPRISQRGGFYTIVVTFNANGVEGE